MERATIAQPVSRERRRASGDPAPLSRGEDARRKILDAAIEEFAANGYAGASVRSITSRAGVNLGALNYYFDGKPRLYRAVLDHVVEQANLILRPIAHSAEAVLADPGAGAPALQGALVSFLDRFLDTLLDCAPAAWDARWSILMARSEFEPPEGEPWPLHPMIATLMVPLAALTGRILGRPEADEECRLLATLMVGQVLAFRPLPAGGLPAMEWDRITPERRDTVRRAIHESADALFRARGVSPAGMAGPAPTA